MSQNTSYRKFPNLAIFEIWSIMVSSTDDVIGLYVSEPIYTTYHQLEIYN